MIILILSIVLVSMIIFVGCSSYKTSWFWRTMFETIVVGLFMVILTLQITNALNPNPEINESCYWDGDEIRFILNNPSKAPAEEYNLIIYEKYDGSYGISIDELCNVSSYFQDEYTLIYCDYIPPKSHANVSINLEDKSKRNFKYSSWGRTTRKKYEKMISCN